jgi:magnesium transporter
MVHSERGTHNVAPIRCTIQLKGDNLLIRTVFYDPADQRLRQGGAELIDEWEKRPASQIWVAIEGELPEVEHDLLSVRFGIHALAIADALRERHPPKIEPFRDNTFILLKGLDAESTSLEFGTIQLSLFVGGRFLVTRSSGRSVSTDAVLSELTSGEIAPDVSRASLALRLCRTVADRFLPLLLAVEKRLDEMEEEMLSKPSDDLLAELVRQKGDLKRILRILQYHAQLFTFARSKTPAQLVDHDHELTDVEEHLDRMLGLARLYYELTDDLMNGYLSLSAHRLNQIMQTLTIVTVVFVPITFMAGIYGMNFERIPELGFRNGYFILLGTMLVVVAGILTLFFKRGWLGGQSRRK